MTSKREHYIVERFGRRYGRRGAAFVGRAWQACRLYQEKHLWGDVALSRVMDQIVRLRKLGDNVITHEQREAALATCWELVEQVQGIGEAQDNLEEYSAHASPEYIDYCRNVEDPKDTQDIHEIRVEPAYIPAEIAPLRQSPEAWRALIDLIPKCPDRVLWASRAVIQNWRLKGGQKYLSWIN